MTQNVTDCYDPTSQDLERSRVVSWTTSLERYVMPVVNEDKSREELNSIGEFAFDSHRLSLVHGQTN